MGWLPLALVAALLFGAHNAFSRAATKGVSNELGTILIQGAAVGAVLLYALVRGRSLEGEARAIGWAVAGGLTVAAGSVLYFELLRRGAGLSGMGPVVLAGTALVTAASGFVFFEEKLTLSRGAGLLLAVAAIALLARD